MLQTKIINCNCGATLTLDRFTNTCRECGKDYDRQGNRLAPRQQWGEETGETYLDVYEVDR